MRLSPLLAPAAALFAALAVHAASTPTIDQLLSAKNGARPRVSPDGRFVVYEVAETDWKENAYVNHLWLADVSAGRAFQLTQGKKSSDAAQWSPNGRWIAFMTERESGAITPLPNPDEREEKKDKAPEAKPDARQIWLVSATGGEAWALTKHGARIESFRWSDDGKRIAFTGPVPETKAAKERKEKYSDYELFEDDFEPSQAWIVDVAEAEKTGAPVEAKQVTTDPKISVDGVVWSPDGTRLAFAGVSSPQLAFGGTADLYLVEAGEKKTAKAIVTLPGPDTAPRFSPDGTQLAFSSALGVSNFFYANRHIVTVKIADVLKKPAKTAADVTDLTGGFDEDATLLEWGTDGIYFRGLQKTASHLYRLKPADRAITRLTNPSYTVGDVAFSPDFKWMTFTSADAKSVSEVFVTAMAAGGGEIATATKLTDFNAQFSSFTLGTAEMISWKSQDGVEIEGVLHKPANYDAKKKYPLLVVIHGGPTGTSRATRAPAGRIYPIQLFLAKGALVLEPNYRGSAGYGEKFRALNVRNLGVGDMWDVMSGVDALIAQGRADPDKLGAMGWSQGGYISAFLTTNTDRFKAISVGAGISNWMTYYVNTDITPFTRQYLQATPWDDPAIYAKTSPMTTIKNAKTPTLIQHGERDKRVPPPNGYELYRGLQDVGVPSALVIYAGFGHGITKPKSNRAVLQHNLDWFSHYVFGESFPKDSPLRGSGAVRWGDN